MSSVVSLNPSKLAQFMQFSGLRIINKIEGSWNEQRSKTRIIGHNDRLVLYVNRDVGGNPVRKLASGLNST